MGVSDEEHDDFESEAMSNITLIDKGDIATYITAPGVGGIQCISFPMEEWPDVQFSQLRSHFLDDILIQLEYFSMPGEYHVYGMPAIGTTFRFRVLLAQTEEKHDGDDDESHCCADWDELSSHYHCARCHERCSMMGHLNQDGTFSCE